MDNSKISSLSAVELFLDRKLTDDISEEIEDNLNYICQEIFGIDLQEEIEGQVEEADIEVEEETDLISIIDEDEDNKEIYIDLEELSVLSQTR